MRLLFHLLLATVAALAVGFGLSYFALTDGRALAAFKVGAWQAWPAVGGTDPDPYTRAYLARSGLLQLGRAEGVQFTATTDDKGQPLERNCRYRIAGATPIASLWTLAATTPDGINIAPPGGLEALHSARIARTGNGAMVLYVSRTLSPDNWLEITGSGPFQLLLTLYDTTNFSAAGGAIAGSSIETLPTITREACS